MASAETKSEETKSSDDRSHVVTAVCIGAIVGGIWGWLYLTSRGATLRNRVDPAVDRLVDTLDTVQSFRTVVKSLAVLALMVGCLALPGAAHAQGLFVPWIGANTGVPGGAPIGFGAAAGASGD